jgi:tetratricopeptide (TPR) repeat protein
MTVVTHELTANGPPVLAYARVLRAVHDLIVQGKGDSEEAESLADQMDAPWFDMTEQEQARMRGLSRDLYALADGGARQVDMSPEEKRRWNERSKAANAAFEVGDLDAALEFLRQPYPRELPRHTIPFFQARCWERLGDLETALAFMKEAERHDPREAVSVLYLLRDLGRMQEGADYANRIMDDPKSPPEELYLSAAVLLQQTRGMSTSQARPVIEQIVPVLRGALEKMKSIKKEQSDTENLEINIADMLGLCLGRLGDLRAAIQLFDETLTRHPNAGGILTARGIARFDSDRPAALRDFGKATQAGDPSVLPYYILARQALLHGNYHEAWKQANRAAERPAPSALRAEIHEAIAIAQSMLGQPLEWVLENFDQAIALDPANQRIRDNRAVAEAGRDPPRRRRPAWRSSDKIDLERFQQAALRSGVESQRDRISERHNERMTTSLLR